MNSDIAQILIKPAAPVTLSPVKNILNSPSQSNLHNETNSFSQMKKTKRNAREVSNNKGESSSDQVISVNAI